MQNKVCPIRMHAIESQSLEFQGEIDLETSALCIENRCAAWDVRFRRCNLLASADRPLEELSAAIRGLTGRI